MAMVTASALGPTPPTQYTGCHSHGEELYIPTDLSKKRDLNSDIPSDSAMVPTRKRLSLPPRQLQLQSKHQLPPPNRMKDHRQRARIAIFMLVLSWCPFSRNPLVEVANVLLPLSKGTALHLEKAKDHPRAPRPGSAPESIGHTIWVFALAPSLSCS